MEEKQIKSSSKKKRIIVVLGILAVVVIGYFYFSGDNPITNNIKIPFPYVNSVAKNTSFGCESLLSSNIIGSPEEYLTNGIEGSIEKGTDKIAMSIKDAQTLILQTSTNVEFGSTEGDNFKIIQNDKENLMAIWFSESTISTIVLNKNNGLAIWLKGNPDFITYGAPYGSMIYMICR